MALAIFFWPCTVTAGPCADFDWHAPRDMIMPDHIRRGQEALQAGQLLEAREWFTTYLHEQHDGVFADGAKWAVAFLPSPTDEPGKEFFQRIDRLQKLQKSHPESVYAPWALCAIGEVYWGAGWFAEASGMFEAFLRTYPHHPLAGGVMVEAGLGYLKNGQFLEAALVLRRVVEEPMWNSHRIKGALGLADATAMAKAWKQAYYWYRVVEAESPELLRQSGDSTYYYGMSELTVGIPANALPKFLLAINLHPHLQTAGLAHNRIAEILLQSRHDFPALWFADQARQRFPDEEGGRRGKAILGKWLVNFLSQGPAKEERDHVYQRLNDLEIYLSLSWDQVLELAKSLRQGPEAEVMEDSLLWMGEAYQALEDIPAAIREWTQLVIVAASDVRRQDAKTRLAHLLHQQIRNFAKRHDWVALLKFRTDHQQAFQLVPWDWEEAYMVAQAYQQVNLPSEALHWYDQLLQEQPHTPLREDLLLQKIFLAEELEHHQLVRETTSVYLNEFPGGRWRGQVKAALGREATSRHQYPEAIQYFSEALMNLTEVHERRQVLRKRAQAYEGLGQTEKAIEDLREIVEKEPSQVGDVIKLGDRLFEHGEYVEAARHYEHILGSDAPAALQAWAKYRFAAALEHMGKSAEAQKLFEEIRQLNTRAPELEHTIRSAATTVLDELSLKEQSRTRMAHEQSES